MPTTDIQKERARYLFSNKGLRKKDMNDISSIFMKYGIDVVYELDDYKTENVSDAILICESNNTMSLHAHSLASVDGLYISLHLMGGFSSWEVNYPSKGGIKERAVASQLFTDVKEILAARAQNFPRLPWSTFRDVLVFIPIFFLVIKVIFPTFIFGYSEILKISISAAVLNYILALIQVRRIFRRVVVVQPTLWERTKVAKGWIGATLAAAAVGLALEYLLNYLKALAS